MEFLRDQVNKSSHSLKRENPDSCQILDVITNLRLEFTRLEYTNDSVKLNCELDKLQESIFSKKIMIKEIDSKIDEWKNTLNSLIPKLQIIKSRQYRSDNYKEFKIQDSNDIISFISSIRKI